MTQGMRAIAVCTMLALAVPAADGRSHKKKERGFEGPPDFAYYLLSLSWAPEFCAQPGGNKDPRECGKGRKVGFIVHGLWPQGDQTRGPQYCGSASPVGRDIVQVMLNYIPSESLIQHEWRAHGTCSGLTAGEYFANARKARDSVVIPQEFRAPSSEMQLSPDTVAAKFAAVNPKFPKGAFRVTCHDGGLQEVRICFNKDLTPRDCGGSAGACRIPTISAKPVQ